MRGISVESPFTTATMSNNTVSGNRYSGIVVWQADFISIGGRIGAGRDLRPLGNGASGVLIDGGQASVAGVIAYNHDFGVAIGPHANHAVVYPDGFLANGIQDIDWGLNGPSRSDPGGRMPSVPVLIDASFDPAQNRTVVRGVLPAEGRITAFPVVQYSVRLFDVTAHGYVMAAPQADLFPTPGDFPFTMSVFGDLRGHTLVAQTFTYQYPDGFPVDSSELSTSFPVHP
jgi:parallel beta-helix repeat protein